MPMIGFFFGIVSYGTFLASSLYAIGFVGNLLVPKSIDSGPSGPLGYALIVNAVLLGLFAVQHSVMARPVFKRWWSKIVPASLERSVYVLISSIFLALLCWQWQPQSGTIWRVESQVGRIGLMVLFWSGWLIVIWSTFMIDHFDLFGLRQVYLHLRRIEYTPVPFKANALYRYVRHPMMLGYLIALWATPHMTLGHLFFALAMSAYIFTGIFFEERDLAASQGGAFARYRNEVPMIIPVPGRRSSLPVTNQNQES
ncbi:MAG: NnrU family protein [Proteobacteria bacterium]|nr:NnrU family protein [Pseudomonadota bacterium]